MRLKRLIEQQPRAAASILNDALKPIVPVCFSFSELGSQFGKLPMTWYPHLLMSLVESALGKDVFLPDKCATFVQNTEDRWRADRERKAGGGQPPPKI